MLNLNKFPKDGNVITLPAALNGQAVIGKEFSNCTFKGNQTFWSLTTPVTGWQEENGLWKAPLPQGHSSLYRNHSALNFSRWPQTEYITCKNWETKWDDAAGKWEINRMHTAIPEEICNDLEGAELSAYFGWMNNRITEFQADPEGISINTDNRQLAGHCKFCFEKMPVQYLAPGQWLPKPEEGFFYYKPLPGESFGDALFETAGEKTILIIDGAENITFENIIFTGNADSSLECKKQADMTGSAAILLRAAKNCTFKQCVFRDLARWAMVMEPGSCGNKIEQCTFDHLGSGAVRIEGEETGTVPEQISSGNIIHACEIRNGGLRWGCCVAISIQHASKTQITNCDISYFPYSGISCGWVWNYKTSPSYGNIIDGNTVHDLGWDNLLIDMGGIYLLGDQPGTMITNNHVYNIRGENTVFGIYLDEGSSNLAILGNLVHGCTSEPFHVHYGKHNLVAGNVFIADPGSPAVGFTRGTMNFKNEFVPGDKVCSFNRNLCVGNKMPIYMKYLLEIEGKQEMLDSWACNHNICVQLDPGNFAAACDDYHDFYKTYREIPDEEFFSPDRDDQSTYLHGELPVVEDLPHPLQGLFRTYLEFQEGKR